MTTVRLFLLSLLFILPLHAQDTDSESSNITDEADLKRFWQLSLPDGNFMVALDRIASISKSSYILDGNLIITEVSIDTVGNALCRIYHIRPIGESGAASTVQRLTERATDLGKRTEDITGANPNAVQKFFPSTTHAKTIEYRVAHLESLNSLYSSLTTAWTQGKGRKFSIAE